MLTSHLILSLITVANAAQWNIAATHQQQPTSLLRRRAEQYYDETDDYWSSPGSMNYGKCFKDNYGNEMVYFVVCPASSGCQSGCSGGEEYVSTLNFFIQGFVQAQVSARCAAAESNCGDDDSCYETYGCFRQEEEAEEVDGADDAAVDDAAVDDAAVDDAYTDDAGGRYLADSSIISLRVQDYLQCTPYGRFYIGAHCQNYMIYLGAFVDDQCTWLADDGAFTSVFGGELAYSVEAGTSLVDETCVACTSSSNGDFYGRIQCQELFTAATDGMTDAGAYEDDIERLDSHSWVDVALMVGLTALATICLMAFFWFRYRPEDEKKVGLLSAFTPPSEDRSETRPADDVSEYQKPPMTTPAKDVTKSAEDESQKQTLPIRMDDVSEHRQSVSEVPAILREHQDRSVSSSLFPPTVARDSPPGNEETSNHPSVSLKTGDKQDDISSIPVLVLVNHETERDADSPPGIDESSNRFSVGLKTGDKQDDISSVPGMILVNHDTEGDTASHGQVKVEPTEGETARAEARTPKVEAENTQAVADTIEAGIETVSTSSASKPKGTGV